MSTVSPFYRVYFYTEEERELLRRAFPVFLEFSVSDLARPDAWREIVITPNDAWHATHQTPDTLSEPISLGEIRPDFFAGNAFMGVPSVAKTRGPHHRAVNMSTARVVTPSAAGAGNWRTSPPLSKPQPNPYFLNAPRLFAQGVEPTHQPVCEQCARYIYHAHGACYFGDAVCQSAIEVPKVLTLRALIQNCEWAPLDPPAPLFREANIDSND